MVERDSFCRGPGSPTLPPPETGQVPEHKPWAGRWRWMCRILRGNLLRDFPLLWHICKPPMKHMRSIQLCSCTRQPIPSCCPSKPLHPLWEGREWALGWEGCGDTQGTARGCAPATPTSPGSWPWLHAKHRQSCSVSSCYLREFTCSICWKASKSRQHLKWHFENVSKRHAVVMVKVSLG